MQRLLNSIRQKGVSLNSLFLRYYSWEVGQLVLPAKQNKSVEVDIVNYGTDGIYFASYGQHNFVLNNGTLIVGPCAAFPCNAFSWNVRDALDIDEEALSLFFVLEPKLDVLIIGKGEKSSRIDYRFIMDLCQKYKMPVEILPTPAAIGTFNFLNSERRYVAAGIIPPRLIDLYGVSEPPVQPDLLEFEVKDVPLLPGDVFIPKDEPKLLGSRDDAETFKIKDAPRKPTAMPRSPLAISSDREVDGKKHGDR